MNAPANITPGFRSLWDVLELNAQNFMAAVVEMRRIRTVMEQLGKGDTDLSTPLEEEARELMRPLVDGYIVAISGLYASAAHISTVRLKENLETKPAFNMNNLRDAIADIESRLHDELGLVRLFVLEPNLSNYLLVGADLVGETVADRLPSALFDMEEAAKCLVLSRPTASAFHSMRALEVAIRALASFLQIPDPTKPAERNWGVVLKAIKEKIDAKYPANKRLPDTDGAQLEALYTTLDAVKNPWRNATMHADANYQPYEATHIIQCVNMFLGQLANFCDETGQKV